jgi:hypothetical protein
VCLRPFPSEGILDVRTGTRDDGGQWERAPTRSPVCLMHIDEASMSCSRRRRSRLSRMFGGVGHGDAGTTWFDGIATGGRASTLVPICIQQYPRVSSRLRILTCRRVQLLPPRHDGMPGLAGYTDKCSMRASGVTRGRKDCRCRRSLCRRSCGALMALGHRRRRSRTYWTWDLLASDSRGAQRRAARMASCRPYV